MRAPSWGAIFSAVERPGQCTKAVAPPFRIRHGGSRLRAATRRGGLEGRRDPGAVWCPPLRPTVPVEPVLRGPCAGRAVAVKKWRTKNVLVGAGRSGGVRARKRSTAGCPTVPR